MAEVMSLAEAVAELVHDGDTVAVEGFTHLIPVAAGQEIIRQGRRDLTLVRMTPDIVYDQMIGAGVRAASSCSAGAATPGSARCTASATRCRTAGPARWRSRSTATPGWPTATWPGRPGCPSRCCAATGGTDLPQHTDTIRPVVCPFTGEELAAVPALTPDVAVLHAQQADRAGNVQLWGITGVQKEVALASHRVLFTVEEVVDGSSRVPARSCCPPGWSTPSPRCPAGRTRPTRTGYSERDNDYYRAWDGISRDRDGVHRVAAARGAGRPPGRQAAADGRAATGERLDHRRR